MEPYRVTIGYGDVGTEQNHFLGQWEGLANSDEDAQKRAHEQFWDYRLDATCVPRYEVKKLSAGDVLARAAGKALEQLYPWGYRSRDSAP